MKNLIPVLALFVFGIILVGCPKPCIEANYSFAVNAQIAPDTDSIKVGDTIFVTSSFSTSLKDQQISQTVDYSNSTDISNTLSISELLPRDTIAKDAVFNFDYVSVIGRIYNDRNIPSPDRVQQITYQEINDSYILKVGLIAKQPGVYILGIGDGLSNGRKKSRSCEKASFSFSITDTNQHFYLITKWKPDIIINDFGKRHGYAFKVY